MAYRRPMPGYTVPALPGKMYSYKGQQQQGKQSPGPKVTDVPGPRRRKKRREKQQQAMHKALRGVTARLQHRGIGREDAQRFARLLLSRPGVTIGVSGNVLYKGERYTPARFAHSGLANFVTGIRAENLNRKAILGDPGYQSSLAQLTFGRDEAVSELDERRRRSILDFGDPAFTDDPLLGGAAAANPFSVSRLLAQQREREQGANLQATNRAGTLFGGGFRSGLAGVEKANAARVTDSTRDLQDLLAGLAQQGAQARQQFQFGKDTALQEATQRMLSTGAIHAARPPGLGFRGFNFWHTLPKKHKYGKAPLLGVRNG